MMNSGTAEAPGNDASSALYRYKFANVEFDEAAGVLRVAGNVVTVEPRPLTLLTELLHRVGEVLSKEELLETVWEGRPTVDHVLPSAVNRLRKALGFEAAGRIVNLPRVGYRFDGPVERMAVGTRPLPALDLHLGRRVPGRDDYRLERQLGHAPDAPVWLARDARLQQLRVFKFATSGTRLTALKREYTFYRVLRSELGERNDFARVLSANFSQAPYFLECEYGGDDLQAWAANGRNLTALPQAARLALLLQIARAVAAAHGVGVLHKDLKPANVLVSAESSDWRVQWVTKLTDFGSSRLLDPGRLAQLGVTALGMTLTEGTATDSLSGTPLYLAPELLAGHAPTMQSDVYALGLMLFQLLVGDLRRPMSTGWERDVDDALLREDLRAATEGQPADRLGSVQALIDRLDRLDARRAEDALRLTTADAAGKAVAALAKARDRRPWVAAAFISLALGLTGSLWFYARAEIALRDAQQQAARARSINEFLNKDVLMSADLTTLAPGKSASMLQVLKQASQGAAQRFEGDPATEASIRFQLGEIFTKMSNNAAASAEYERAAALLAPGGTAVTRDLLLARFALSTSYAKESKLAESTALLERNEHDAADSKAAADAELEQAATMARFSNLFMRQKFAEALPLGERLLVLRDRLYPNDALPRFEARYGLAEAKWRSGQSNEAEALLQQVLKPPFSAQTVGEVNVARARIMLARVRISAGKAEGEEAALLSARALLLQKAGPEETFVAIASSELANLYDSAGDYQRSAAALESAYASFMAQYGAAHQSTRITSLNLAITQLNAGQVAVALQRLEGDRPWFASNLGGESGPVVQSIDFQRARALSMLGRPAQALGLLATLDDKRLAEAEPSPDWPWRLQAEKARAQILLQRREEGTAALRTALKEMEALKAPPRVLAEYRRVLASAATPASQH